jgi:23S rRNA pseudouridine2605 synthase
MPEERIQKVLAAAGVASRRASETLIAAGRVRIDGKPAIVGQKVDPDRARIEVDGSLVGVNATRAYVALHKPAGVTSTTRDRHAATTVLDLVPTALAPDNVRLYPVGRLDQDSEGLLLLTNDGDWADRILHPRFGVEREYAVALAAPLDGDRARALNAGIRLEEGMGRLAAPIHAATPQLVRELVATLDPPPDPSLAWYRAVLAQGWKRQLRRMFGAVDAPFVRLVRVRIGAVRLGDLPSGRARSLKAPEIQALATNTGAAAAAVERPGRYRSKAAAGSHRTPPARDVAGARRTAAARGNPVAARRPGSSGPRRPRP